MDVKITLFESSQYTDYSFENALKRELAKSNRNILSFQSTKKRERVGFRKKDMIEVNIQIDGEEIQNPDEFNETVAKAVTEAANHVSLDIYGIE
ncbi:hypothetical protein ACFPTR_03420 [Aliibacillus thermotolerans]|uniref:Uncharacterized protein n=1 Tax=Aliibacillus thermotolerans TaxID=1834418 RepID=A0ABW0U3B1_9BACI|nr:hypothetical protein [Aliibacillus thermotolerans]MDA3129094.1 hypothetical protein [Aliibacillus thermotolerans]